MANDPIRISDGYIGSGSPVFMIAEIGINHNGSLEIAKRLIDASFACGWQCVKFQKRTPDICVPESQKGVWRDTPWGRMTYLEYRYKVEFGPGEYSYLDKYCREKPIFWTASVWDLPSLKFLMDYDVPFVKIPSAKLTESDLVAAVAQTGKPVVLSTGMSTVEEIDRAIELLEKHTKGDYVLMHTNSAYPAPAEELNLRVIDFLRQRYRCVVGYSGHEYDLEPSVIAVSLGARVVERHVTVDHELWGSDQAASLEVHAMNMLFKRIKDIDVMLGDGVKRLTSREKESRRKLRG